MPTKMSLIDSCLVRNSVSYMALQVYSVPQLPSLQSNIFHVTYCLKSDQKLPLSGDRKLRYSGIRKFLAQTLLQTSFRLVQPVESFCKLLSIQFVLIVLLEFHLHSLEDLLGVTAISCCLVSKSCNRSVCRL
jgi:hypothetical protein